jgi:hypothetical protein
MLRAMALLIKFLSAQLKRTPMCNKYMCGAYATASAHPQYHLSSSSLAPLCLLEFRGPKEANPRASPRIPRSSRGEIEVPHRAKRDGSEVPKRTNRWKGVIHPTIFLSSSHPFPNTVPKTGVFSRRICRSSFRFPQFVTSLSEHRPIFEKAEREQVYICFISYCRSEFRSGLTGKANPETLFPWQRPVKQVLWQLGLSILWGPSQMAT